MRDTLINLVAKFSGFNAVWSFLDGKKAYGTCALGVLTGAAALGAQVAPILAAHDTAGLVNFLSGLPTNPAFLLAWGSCGGVAAVHRLDKAADAAKVPEPKDPDAKP